ncbi:hypothetical protein Daesc_000188 [Daldinia eschscholtzii]|uniref:Cytochrome P450 n=1 Tax=Daldinia eschscholtzii TaxID=292717 RepID=A0AAX6MY32_9PEZI
MIKKEAERAVLSENEDIKVTATRKISQPETLFSVLRRSKAVPEEKTAARMAHEGVEMLMASFTPGHTMMFGMYYLHSNPHVLETLRRELDQANPDPAVDLTFRLLNTLPYLRAVVKELLRISFPMGMRLPMICRKDIQYEKWNIPAYTAISVNHRGLVFDPEVFVDPLKFKPERWLDSANVIDEKRYYVPFGKGARMCPGRDPGQVRQPTGSNNPCDSHTAVRVSVGRYCLGEGRGGKSRVSVGSSSLWKQRHQAQPGRASQL